MNKIAIVTPIKNEINNIPRLLASIEQQSIQIFSWIIIDNDSIDGTKEYLEKISHIKNVNKIYKLELPFKDKTYQLGFKYSTIIKHGFDFLKTMDYYDELDYIGILDADCFPEWNYFEKLVFFMSNNNKIGIASGILLLENGSRGFSNSDHVRGSGRLWKKKCFDEAGYYVGISADSISRIKAELKGWDAKVEKSAFYYSREANSIVNLEYGGRSAYYNGFTLTYVFFKSLLYLFRKPKQGLFYFIGFIKSLYNKDPKNPDAEIIDYNHKLLQYKTYRLFALKGKILR